uniref:Uncharacterized protein n=1 Tax=Anguilla anguilla TaxID=7936 RepID=A0A0E9QYX6_ANGAN
MEGKSICARLLKPLSPLLSVSERRDLACFSAAL